MTCETSIANILVCTASAGLCLAFGLRHSERENAVWALGAICLATVSFAWQNGLRSISFQEYLLLCRTWKGAPLLGGAAGFLIATALVSLRRLRASENDV